ncbi:MAG: transcriptional regulator NrdR [bacterium]
MRCPGCGHEDTRVLESRLSYEGRAVRRRRSCPECNYRFTTYEQEEAFVFQIKKRDGRVESYHREKALRSIQVACQKRPVTIDQIESLLGRIERNIQDAGERVVASEKLGGMVLEALTVLDKVAYVRFASVYKDFKDTEQFMRELNAIQTPGV